MARKRAWQQQDSSPHGIAGGCLSLRSTSPGDAGSFWLVVSVKGRRERLSSGAFAA